jgi:hypothetical protein
MLPPAQEAPPKVLDAYHLMIHRIKNNQRADAFGGDQPTEIVSSSKTKSLKCSRVFAAAQILLREICGERRFFSIIIEL